MSAESDIFSKLTWPFRIGFSLENDILLTGPLCLDVHLTKTAHKLEIALDDRYKT